MKTIKIVLSISLLINVFFILKIAIDKFNSPTNQLGELKQDVSIKLFNHADTVLFKLPKGLTVRNVSERGFGAIGQFENNRFEIVITSSQANLVDYSKPEKELLPFGNYYSADMQDVEVK